MQVADEHASSRRTRLSYLHPANNTNKQYANPYIDVDITKRFLIKTYNKLDTQCDIGVLEAISHLLNIPDHYTDAVFERLHTSHLL